jgi:hypothetical protein
MKLVLNTRKDYIFLKKTSIKNVSRGTSGEILHLNVEAPGQVPSKKYKPYSDN